MALFKKALRSWSPSIRLLATEVPLTAVKPVTFLRTTGRLVSATMLKERNLTITEWLKEDNAFKAEDFVAARKELLSSEDIEATEETVDMIIVNVCLEMKRIDAAMSYLRLCWDSKAKFNVSCMATYLKLCYTRESPELNEMEKKYLLDIYDTVRKRYPLLDATTGEYCILGISKTERWKESFEILDMIKLSCKPRASSYSAIISAAFNNNEPEAAWKYLREAIVRFNPEHLVYLAYLRYCNRNFQGEELENEIGKMFKFWGDFDVRPYVDVINAYVDVFKDLGWQTERTSIREVGICRNCSHRLCNFEMSSEEFTKMARLVRERVIIGDDVYRKTTPKELKGFLQFVEQKKPWDIVIDGLNVSYLTKSSQKTNGYLVKSAVSLGVGMGKKVLVLGRKHMMKWPKLDLSYIQQVGHIFLAENGSADDPYLLYATLCSGPATMFVSRDLMRQHKFLLEDSEITRIFKHWQMTHQLRPTAITSKRGTLEIKWKSPPKYLPVVQKYEGGWHIPFTFESSLQPSPDYETPKTWFCLIKKPSSKHSENVTKAS